MGARSMNSRVGREKQVYSAETGARVVAGCVVLNNDKSKVLIISATKPEFWVIPKGGVESDESGPEEAAVRETWEEAGVVGQISKSLGKFEDARPPKTWVADTKQAALQTWPPRSEFHFFEMVSEDLHDEFPEQKKRDRKWVSYGEARDELLRHNRHELVWALDASSISR